MAAPDLFSRSSGAVHPPRSIAAALGLWRLTRASTDATAATDRWFASAADVEIALAQTAVPLRDPIRVRLGAGEIVETTAGRVVLATALGQRLPFSLLNRAIDVDARAHLLEIVADLHGANAAAALEADLDRIGIAFATRSGASLAADDLRAPPEKPEILEAALAAVAEAQRRYDEGEITEGERYNKTINAWQEAERHLEGAIAQRSSPEQPLGDLVASGIVSAIDARRVVAMVGLASTPYGSLVECPIAHGFAEGLTPHEHFLATTGARHQTLESMSRRERGERLERHLLAALGDLRVTEIDCGARRGRALEAITRERRVLVEVHARAIGRASLEDVEGAVRAGAAIDPSAADRLRDQGILKVAIRSLLDCRAQGGVCQRCYGWDPITRRLVAIGARVGLAAARAIVGAGIDLPLRTFHISGAVYSSNMRTADASVRAGIIRFRGVRATPDPGGDGLLMRSEEGRIDVLDAAGAMLESFCVKEGDWIQVSEGARVAAQTILLHFALPSSPEREDVTRSGLPGLVELLGIVRPSWRAIVARADGTVRILEQPRWRGQDGLMRLDPASGARSVLHRVPRERSLLVDDGERVEAGQALTTGSRDHRDLLRALGPRRFADHLLHELCALFVDSGRRIAEQHLEIAVREMIRYARVKDPGDTDLEAGSVVPRAAVRSANATAAARGATRARSAPVLISIAGPMNRRRD